MKVIIPNWELTKDASLVAIGREYGALVNIDHGHYLELPFSPYRQIYALPLCDDFTFVFGGVLDKRHSLKRVKGFLRRVFFNILAASLNYDTYNGCFYILKCKEFYKIGITQDFDARNRRYVTENPFEIERVFVHKIHCAHLVESYLKKTFRHKNHRGEWFNFSNRDLLFITSALDNIILYE
jgi:hypothetical protein